MKPILFNTQMVQAILQGKKTCTRRIIKSKSKDACGFTITYDCNNKFKDVYDHDENGGIFNSPQSRYHIGDILYVRETWSTQYNGIDDDNGYGEYVYKADGIKIDNSEGNCSRWKPSIHMPKEAVRIFLRVTDVRVEKLQDITDEGAKKEGSNLGVGIAEKMRESAIDRFIKIWNGTVNKKDKDKYSWEANPYVWVIEFKVISKEEALNE